MQVTALNLAWALARTTSVRRFHAALKDPLATQQRWLSQFLSANAHTAYGRAHGYGRIRSISQFRERVPVSNYETLTPWISRIERGEREVLTHEKVRVLERTSGSVAGPKHVPYTAGLLGDFGAATGPWLDDLSRAFPSLFTTRQYWSLSPVARDAEVTSGGVRIGLEDDTEYFDAATRFAMKRLFAVEGSVARLRELDLWRRKTLTQLLAAEDLGFISIWNPSFLTLLMEALRHDWPSYREALSPRRRDDIDARLERAGSFVGEALWPRLRVISCWTDAWAAQAVPGLRRFFPHTPFQGKGLLATEGVVSFPLWGQRAPVAAVTSHFLEFESLDDGTFHGVHELREGARYAPLLTTRGGFARYRLSDVVRCVGFLARAPLLQFEGRLDRGSDLRGEKLNAAFVEAAVRATLQEHPAAFALVAPELEEPPRYVVYVEGAAQPETLAADLEQRFCEAMHYRYARELGQLGPVVARAVTRGEARYVAALQSRGVRLGDIKPSGFDPRPGWAAVFGG
jgi:hypothetical protein